MSHVPFVRSALAYPTVRKTVTAAGRVEFQSKAGACNLDSYTLENVPPEIAGNLIGESDKCRACGATITLRGAVVLMREVTPN
jgi:hypothetical protein